MFHYFPLLLLWLYSALYINRPCCVNFNCGVICISPAISYKRIYSAVYYRLALLLIRDDDVSDQQLHVIVAFLFNIAPSKTAQQQQQKRKDDDMYRRNKGRSNGIRAQLYYWNIGSLALLFDVLHTSDKWITEQQHEISLMTSFWVVHRYTIIIYKLAVPLYRIIWNLPSMDNKCSNMLCIMVTSCETLLRISIMRIFYNIADGKLIYVTSNKRLLHSSFLL